MQIDLTAEQADLKQTVRAAAERDLPSMAERSRAANGESKEVFSWAANLGLIGVNVPVEFGGGGGTKIDSVVVAEELGRVESGLAAMITGQSSVATEAIIKFGSEEQKSKLLPAIFGGSSVMGVAMTEPDIGSNIAGVQTTAHREPGGYRLNGVKTFIGYAGIADRMAVMARIAGTSGRDGLTLFLVDTDQPGYQYMGPIHKLGQQSADTGAFALEDAWASDDDVVGEEGQAFSYIQHSLTSGRIDYAARSVGLSQACYDEAVGYARIRAPFGVPIIDHQVTQFKLARMAMDIEASRGLVYRAASAFEVSSSGKETELFASMAKLHGAETAQKAAWESVQIHGAYGYSEESRVAALFRDARIFTISEGTSEVQLMLMSRYLDLKGSK